MKLILGSSSKNRQGVLQDLGCKFEILAADIDEKSIRANDLYQLSLLIAREKIKAVLSQVKEPAIVIAADTIVLCGGELFEKPQDEAEARRFFEKYKQFPAETVSAVVVANTATDAQAEGVNVARVFFDPIPTEVIDTLIKSGIAFTWAGGFGVRHELIKPYIKKIEGTMDSLSGLPLDLLKKLIKQVALDFKL